MPRIDAKRLLADLRGLAEIGKYKTGVHRPTYSPQDMEARQWLTAQMTGLGLDARVDGIGNCLGSPRTQGPKLLIGSHLESQNHAGWLDGALGVIFALEVARAFQEDAACAHFPIEVVAWADEEGHFGNFLGSRSFVGQVADEEIDRAANADGLALRAALVAAGLDGVPRERVKAEDYLGYLEAHIEQGDYLDQSQRRVGIVTGIVGIYQYRIQFVGQQNHAGTTRMAVRRDAGAALVRFTEALHERFALVGGERSVWTIGNIVLKPGRPSIIPGEAEMLIQIRDIDTAQLELFEATLRGLAEEHQRQGPCQVEVQRLWTIDPVPMSDDFQSALKDAARTWASDLLMEMPSAAGHDAQVLAKVMPAGMLFVPSLNGVSHHWTEDTHEDDIILGCQVLADAVEAIFKARE